jgi:ATP-dependent DNA helicase RecG
VEFKVNNANPEEVGKYTSALAYAAALHGKTFTYLVWGVRDDVHRIVRNQFDPFATKVGNGERKSWPLKPEDAKIDFRFIKS